MERSTSVAITRPRSLTGSLFCLLILAGLVQANPEVYQRALRSTGWVLVPKNEKQSALGTCWLADRDRRLVITCQHVVGDSREVLIYFPCSVNGQVRAESGYYLKQVPASNGRVIATDPVRDLALIQLPAVPEGIQALPLAPRSCQPGESVHSIGNPDMEEELDEGTLWWYTLGTVRQVYRQKLMTAEGAKYVRCVETQSPVNQGDSGGPVVNDRCQVIGVTQSYRADRRLVSQNIDVQEVKAFLAQAGQQPESAAVPLPLMGGWLFTLAGKEGKKTVGRAEFNKDGTFALVPAEGAKGGRKGRFAYANEVLWLICEDGHVCVNVSWDNKDRFKARGSEPKLVFERCK